MDYVTGLRKEGFDLQKLFRLPVRAEKRMLDRPFTRDLVVTDVGCFPLADGHIVEREVGWGKHILVFCLQGKGWVSWGERHMEIGAMEVFWIPQGEAHCYGSHQTDPWEIYWVHAYGSSVEDLLAWTPLTIKRPITTFSNNNALRRQFNTLLQKLESGYADQTLLEMSRFFVSLVTLLHVDSGAVREIEQRERVEKSMEEMRQTLSAPLTLKEYARSAGFSVSQFSYLFKKNFGTSPMAYFLELRIQRAKHLLDSTGMSIKEVAWELGFEDQLYFSRIFKKVSGLPPTAYRMEHTPTAT